MNRYLRGIIVFGVLGLVVASCSLKPKVPWENYKAGKLEEAKGARMPVVLDFYADWCVSCHELEKYTYTNAAVIEALQGFKRLKVDATRQNNAAVNQLVERFNIEGLPTVIFLNEKGEEVKEARIEGFVEPVQFLQMVQLVLTGTDSKQTQPVSKKKK